MTEIHERLASDCIRLGRLPLNHLLLMNDSNYPWFILVPARDGIREIYQLEVQERAQLLDESCALSEFIMDYYKGEKLNVAALGNQVPQLHLHHIVRYASDAAWPGPIWGKHAARAYSTAAIDEIRTLFSTAGLSDYVPAPW
ncbi:MAG: HIT domain-containing protein [Gammaproteobacteria bacterium]|nr:HIT domain-containing protein [Gammaproteobacteria bacterium]